jgi:hypothetical protein
VIDPAFMPSFLHLRWPLMIAVKAWLERWYNRVRHEKGEEKDGS